MKTTETATSADEVKHQQRNDRVAQFHKRSGQSHAEARKLLTGMAVGSIGVLYATLTGKDAPSLDGLSKSLALVAILLMTFAAGFGLAAWRADAAWAFNAAENFDKKPALTKPDGGSMHTVKKWCDRSQVTLFALGLLSVALLTLSLLL